VHRIILALLLLLAVPQGSFSQNPDPVPPAYPPQSDQKDRQENVPARIQKEMEKKANAQRQVELKRDADRLFKLSTELKEYVDKSNENVLSLDVVKKAEEIEKLAHSVRTKMRGYN
jgi:methionyl-tRNA synthetase